MSIAVVIVAAGKGERLGAGVPKAFATLAGKPLLAHAIENLAGVSNLSQVIVAAPESHLETANQFLRASQLKADLKVVQGGQTRQQSIANALAEVAEGTEVTLIHDAARALATSKLFDTVAQAVLATHGGVVPTVEVVDTIKKVAENVVYETVDRTVLAIAQTPQGFPTDKLVAAYAHASQEFTDDAALFQAWGGGVTQVRGEANAFKITSPADLANAERLFSSQLRTGLGTDTHRFAKDGTLKLACIEWPGTPALEGHSDGDAVAHAIVDALLAAAGLGDIGSNFGVDRPEYSGASGEVFLQATLELLSQRGLRVVNVSVQVISNRPKIGPRRAEAEAKLSSLLGAPVSVGATTTDGLGFLGNDEGLAAVATALVSGGVTIQDSREPLDRLGS